MTGPSFDIKTHPSSYNTVAADALAPFVARPSATTILNMQYWQVLVFNIKFNRFSRHLNSHSMENWFQCNSTVGFLITMKFFPCHGSAAVVPCANFHSIPLITTWMRAGWSNHRIWIWRKSICTMGPSTRVKLLKPNDAYIYAVNWCVSRWYGRDTMDVIFFFISRPGGLTCEKV